MVLKGGEFWRKKEEKKMRQGVFLQFVFREE
jgi:hypothetical protein